MLDLKPYSADEDENWWINSEKNVLIRIGHSSIYRAWGVGNIASKYETEDILTLGNIYVKEDCRGRGLFKKYMEELLLYASMRNKALILFPTPYEFDKCPFKYGKKARVVEDKTVAKKERLISWYREFGLDPVKTAYYGDKPIVGDVVNTMISGESEPRKARKNEYFARMIMPENFGGQFLGANFGCTYPQSLFYQEEFHPDFLEKS